MGPVAMIPLKADEITLLIQVRDLLKHKLEQAVPSNDLWLKNGYDGVMGVLKHGAVDVT
jgi:hypothetical protein